MFIHGNSMYITCGFRRKEKTWMHFYNHVKICGTSKDISVHIIA